MKMEEKERANSNQTNYKEKRWCGYCKKDNHNEDVCFFKHGRNQFDANRNREMRSCFSCGKTSHLSRDCRRKRHEQAQANQEEDDDEEEEEYQMFSARQEDKQPLEENMWLIDSGCTNHMTSNENLFTRINTRVNVPIRVGDGTVIITKGKGDTSPQHSQESTKRFSDG